MWCPSCGWREIASATPERCAACGAPGPEPSEALADGRYRLRMLLGEGSQKRTFLARDLARDCDVAVSLYHRSAGGGWDEAGLFRELQRMCRMGDHPRLVAVLDAGSDADRLFVVSEYVGGGTLEEELDRTPQRRVGVERALAILDPLLEALAYAHARDVVHRDVKPSNIWLDERGGVRLGDFGLAAVAREAEPGAVAGTPAYAAPEQTLGRPADGRADLYAAGAVLYEMLTGSPPFPGESAAEVIAHHVSRAAPAPSEVDPNLPPELDALVAELMAKAPEERPRSARAARTRLAALQRGLEATPQAAGEASPPQDPWVGREQELGVVQQALDEALGGRAGAVLVFGEAGIGKTGLAERLLARARARGARTLMGRCEESAGAPAYWPWRSMLRSLLRAEGALPLRSVPGPTLGVLADLLPELTELLPDLPAPPPVDPEQGRFRLFDASARILRRLAEPAGLVLLLDDVHWADEASLALLHFLLREAADARLLVVATCRAEEIDEHVERTLASILREPGSRRVELRGLSAAEVESLATLQSGRAVSVPVARMLLERTGGNPLFVTEVVRHLEEAELADGLGGEDVDALRVARLPAGIRAVIARRLGRLGPACVEALQTAAVIGPTLDLPLQGAVSGLDPGTLRERLEPALRADLLRADPRRPGRLVFAHSLVRETVYESTSSDARAAVHRRIVEEIEALGPAASETRLDALAYHAAQASRTAEEAERAVGWALRASERAVARLAFEQAAAHCRRALTLLEAHSSDERRRCELLLAFAEARARIAVYDADAVRSFAEAAAGARTLDDAALFARAALGLAGAGGRSFEVGRYDPERVRMLEEALERLSPGEAAREGHDGQETELRARVAAQLATELCFSQQDPARIAALGEEAKALAERVGSPALEAFVLDRRHWSLWGPGNTEERMRTAGEIVALATATDDRELLMRGHHFALMDAMELGDVDRVESELEIHDRLSVELGLPIYLWWTRGAHVSQAILQGRFEEAAKLAHEALALGRRAEQENAVLSYSAQMGVVRREQDRLSESAIRQMAERFPALPGWRCALAVACVDSGNERGAQAELDHLAQDRFEGIRRDALWLTSMTLAAEAASALGDARAAEMLYEKLEPYANRCTVFGYGVACSGSAARFLGMLAATLGRWDEAEAHFRTAIETNRRMKARPWLAHSEHEWARMLLERRAPGDVDTAIELIARALRTAEALAMGNLLRKLLTLRLHLQGADDASPTSSIDVVTSRVRQGRPDLRPYATPKGRVTLVFSDVVGFTEMTDRLGDRESYRIMRQHNAVVRQELARHDGVEVELLGDGFVLAFTRAHDAMECMCAVRSELSRRMERVRGEPLRVRIGIHTGEVIREFERFFGRTVILASRIAESAAPGEILVSDATYEELGEAAQRLGPARELELKGFTGTHRVWEAPDREPSRPHPAS